jgi:dTDP-4-dehydrorhamnose reductase
MTMRLLITGGSSYLGRHLVPLARAAGHDVRYTWFTHDPLALPGGVQVDLRAGAATAALHGGWQPEAIVHLAGSNRSADMTEVIVAGTRHITALARRCQARLIHLSTDVLFDGTAAPYDESADPAPRHPYGAAKAAAEPIVAAWPDHVIVRTSLIYGLRLTDMGTAWMLQKLAAGERITLFTNQWRNPISADDLSAACLELLTHPHTGVLNVAGCQPVTRADFGLKLLARHGVPLNDQVQLAPDESGRFPRDCRLAIGLAQRLLRTPLRGVDAVLAAAEPGSQEHPC